MEMSEDRLSALSMMPTHERPKSAALMCPSAEISRLSGLMSLWMMPCAAMQASMQGLPGKMLHSYW